MRAASRPSCSAARPPARVTAGGCRSRGTKSASPDVADLEKLCSESGRLARVREDFRARPFQLEMAQAVAEAIAGNGMLVGEAGTGTGKAVAYLVPALLSGGKVIISTGTKTLQDQLFDRDIPTVREALKVPVTV